MLQLSVTIDFVWSNILTFAAGALLVWLFWSRERRRRAKVVDLLREAIRELVLDGRKNALVENIVSRVESGKEHALRDFELLDKVVRAAFQVCQTSGGLWKVWQNYRQRAFAASREIEEAHQGRFILAKLVHLGRPLKWVLINVREGEDAKEKLMSLLNATEATYFHPEDWEIVAEVPAAECTIYPRGGWHEAKEVR